MDNFKITKTILENINEQNDRINECVDIVNGYTTDEETRVSQELQRQENELRREEQYNNNESKFAEINTQLETKASKNETANIQTQINDLVLGAVGDGNNAEVVQARNGNETLNNRFNIIESLNNITYNEIKFYDNDTIFGSSALNNSIWLIDNKISGCINKLIFTSVYDCNGYIYLLKEIDGIKKVIFEKNVSIIQGENTIYLNSGINDECYIAISLNKNNIFYSDKGTNNSNLKIITLNDNKEVTNISDIGVFQLQLKVITVRKVDNIKKNLSKNVFIVSKYEDGDFNTINEALNYAYTIESKTNPITILIYPGIYNEVCFIGGKHYVSLVGVNRETCIISDSTGLYNNAPIRIQGNSYVANLTIKATHPVGWLPSGEGTVSSYAIHIDDEHNNDNDNYYCHIDNCILYSENFPSVGCGMQKNQTVEISNCIIEKKLSDDYANSCNTAKTYGALFLHPKWSIGSNGNEKFILRNNIIKTSHDRAFYVEGANGEDNKSLDILAHNNTFYSSELGKNNIYINGANGSTLNPLSYGNNIDLLNA